MSGSRRAAAAGAILSLAAAGCGERVGDPLPQWTVFVGTDAPVPQLGDRLLIEVLADDGSPACLGCRRQLGAGDPAAWPISFGVVPPEGGGGVRVRARLYLADHTGADGLPSGLPVIDALARLPSPDGPVDVGLALSMSCLGVASDVAGRTTCDPGAGALAPEPELALADGGGDLPRPGTWPGAAEAPCPAAPPDGMACLPGGLFLLGDPYFFPTGGDLDPLPEHLVRLSPFALDLDEVTVGEVRARIAAGEVQGAPIVRSSDPGELEGACTYLGQANTENDPLPASCVSRPFAEAVCLARGARLPTEAEWEYAAINGTRETRFPWGDVEGGCKYAIVGRGRSVLEADVEESTTCRTEGGTPWGPLAGGSDADVTELGVKNLSGNVSEWVADRFQRYDEPCWNPGPTLLPDPRCDAPSPALGPAWSIRGGAWNDPIFKVRAVERNASASGGPLPSIGFRCARSF